MTATRLRAPAAVRGRTIAATLVGVHDCWIERLAEALGPAMSLASRLSERFEATQYVAEQFRPELELESTLSEALAERLAPESRRRLGGIEAAHRRAADELADTPRHRWDPARVALLSGRLVELARYWCAELELATAALTWADLPAESEELIWRVER